MKSLPALVEALLLAAGEPVSRARLAEVLGDEVDAAMLDQALHTLAASYAERGIELVEVASGLRLQASSRFAPWLVKLNPQRAPRYSRAVLETLALIAWKQPITRAEIEAIRGVAVNPSILKTLHERGWIHSVGRRETPGRPEPLGTTRQFLDDFNLRSLDELAEKLFPGESTQT
ncbi:MAG: SMC-Scp complex subunit ScpB [Gammaproteobacteria bacterium 28-57-27]|nr:MAG: SMC-Scp complex subunit ScpB [Gammaproteobacteria bacterium 28-57-27]